MPIIQHITATIAVSGPKPVQIASNGDGSPGSFVSVRIGGALIYVHDQLAAECYANAWLCDDTAGPSLFLSKTVRPMVITDPASEHYPVVAIHAHGSDKTISTYDPNRRELIIHIGYVRWVVRDQRAYRAHATAWRQVAQLALLVLPRSTMDRKRRAGFRPAGDDD